MRRAGWDRGCSTRRVWAAAAMCLWQAHADDPTLPLDSELFVASQSITGSLGDPWSELTQPDAGRRYRSQVRRIVERLRAELSREVQLAERRMEDPRIDPRLALQGPPALAPGVLHRRPPDRTTGDRKPLRRRGRPAAQRLPALPGGEPLLAAAGSLSPGGVLGPAGIGRTAVRTFQAIHRDELILTGRLAPIGLRHELTRVGPLDSSGRRPTPTECDRPAGHPATAAGPRNSSTHAISTVGPPDRATPVPAAVADRAPTRAHRPVRRLRVRSLM